MTYLIIFSFTLINHTQIKLCKNVLSFLLSQKDKSLYMKIKYKINKTIFY